MTVTEATKTWCVQRNHPWVTYNPLMHRTWCRCGERQQAGEAPENWAASWEIFHDHSVDGPCRCYVGGKAS